MENIFLPVLGMLTRKRVIVATALRVPYEECSMVVFWQQQLLLCLDALYLAKVPSATVKTKFINQTVNYRVQQLIILGGHQGTKPFLNALDRPIKKIDMRNFCHGQFFGALCLFCKIKSLTHITN
jgi:hypothetical protein